MVPIAPWAPICWPWPVPTAEGFEAVFPYDPTRSDPKWLDFNRRFTARFHEPPEQFASLAYDAMNALLDSICKAGLNRARIHDALADIDQYDGVTGRMVFDPNQKNVAPMYLGHGAQRRNYLSRSNNGEVAGAERRRAATAQMPYARVGEDGVSYAGPQRPNAPDGRVSVVLFGPQASNVAHSAEMQAIMAASQAEGRPWEILPVASDQNWGAASTQLVHALWDQHAIAIVALDRDSAHLSEQLALKAFVPVIALSDDRALTSTNVPWIFRLPARTTPSAALQLLKAAETRSGPNSERLRDVLASGNDVAGVAFLPTGEPRTK